MSLVEKLRSEEFCREALSILAIVVSAFALLALSTYDAADLGVNAFPANLITDNGAGTLGAHLASFLYSMFGLSSFLLVGLTLVWSTIYFMRRDVRDIGMKVIGISMLVVATSVLFSLRTDPMTFGWADRTPSYGGLLGDALAAWLQLRFGKTGVYLLVMAFMAVSFLLATDLFFYPLFSDWIARMRVWIPTLFPRRVAIPAGAGMAAVGLGGGPGVSLQLPKWLQSTPQGGAVDDEKDDTPSPLDDMGRPVEKAQAPEVITATAVSDEEQEAMTSRLEAAEEAAREASSAAAEEKRKREEAESLLARHEEELRRRKEEKASRARALKEKSKRAVKAAPREAVAEGEPVAGDGDAEFKGDPPLPPSSLLDLPAPPDNRGVDSQMREKASTLIDTLSTFKIDCELANIDRGPVITMFEIALAPGIKVQRVAGLADNIAMALKAPSVRIVAPIPGKSTVGVEVPNLDRVAVRMREVAESDEFTKGRMGLPVILGKEATGKPLVTDLCKMPHLLIAGQTGAGKSVCINSLLLSLLLSRKPSEVKLLLVDPKQVELGFYADIPHLMLPVVTDMKAAARILDWAVQEMEERYEILSRVGVRSLVSFNNLDQEVVKERLRDQGESPEKVHRWSKKMPYIVIVIDELADLMMVAAKEVEAQITRLAQKSRAIGIHLILATQRPSVDVITGLIKANVPCRVSFQVACKIDSRTILDGPGAEKLLGRGDLLYRAPASSFLHRAQGAFVDDAEVQRVVSYLTQNSAPPRFDPELFAMTDSPPVTSSGGGEPGRKDELYDSAVRVILENQRGSVSLLQRKLQIGYTRAAKLIDYMQEDGIVGVPNGSKAREITMTIEEWDARQGKEGGAAVIDYSSPEDPIADDDAFESEDDEDEFEDDDDFEFDDEFDGEVDEDSDDFSDDEELDDEEEDSEEEQPADD